MSSLSKRRDEDYYSELRMGFAELDIFAAHADLGFAITIAGAQESTNGTASAALRCDLAGFWPRAKVVVKATDTAGMDINVAGTQAVGDFLASQIQNTRILMGEIPDPMTTPTVPPVASTSTAAGSVPSGTQLRQEVEAARAANTQVLFGITPSTPTLPDAAFVPAVAAQTPVQLAATGNEADLVAQKQQTASTLLNSLGIGAKFNTNA